MGLLEARATIPLNEVDGDGLDLSGAHLSPVEDDLGVEVLDLVEVDELVPLEALEEVEVDLQAGRHAHDRHDHAQAAVPDYHRGCDSHVGRVARGLGCGCVESNHWGSVEGLKVLEGQLVAEDAADIGVEAEGLLVEGGCDVELEHWVRGGLGALVVVVE